MRVLHLIYDDPENPWVAGGGAVRVREIYRRLAGRLRSVTVATGAYPGASNQLIDGVRYVRLGAADPYAWSRATYSFHASRLLAAGEYDAAVIDFSTYTPLWLPEARPVGVTVHHITGTGARDRWGSILGRAVAWQEARRLRRAQLFSATSARTEERLRELLGSRAVIRRIGAGVPDRLFDLPRLDAGFLLYFGRLDWYQKGLDTLLEAVAAVVRRYPDLRLRIAGRGRDAPRVEEVARRLGIAPNVEVLGPVDEAKRDELFSSAAVLVMPSRFEGFGMVAAEAMAAGLPVVASDVDSLPEVVAAPAGGVLVPPGDVSSYAAVLERLLSSDEERARISRSARESAGRFRWDKVANEHLIFLEEIAASVPTARPRFGPSIDES